MSPEHVRQFLNTKRDALYSQSMPDTLMTILRLSLDQGMFEEKIHRNVARDVAVPQAIKQTKEVKAWSRDEAMTFLDANAEDLHFALYSGDARS